MDSLEGLGLAPKNELEREEVWPAFIRLLGPLLHSMSGVQHSPEL